VECVEAGPDDEVQEKEGQKLVEAADKTIRRQAPQEQQPESAREIAKKASAQKLPRRFGRS